MAVRKRRYKTIKVYPVGVQRINGKDYFLYSDGKSKKIYKKLASGVMRRAAKRKAK